jgi:hypothetical protein
MKLLQCIVCDGEIDIINSDRSVNKKVKCKSCGFTNIESQPKTPEVLVIRRRSHE